MSTQRIITNKIDQALHRHGLPLNSPLREELEQNAVIGGSDPEVRIRHGYAEMTLDQRIGQLRKDPNFRDCFPAPPRTVSIDDAEAIRAEFDSIAKGTTQVVGR